jgi:hypothetical protein
LTDQGLFVQLPMILEIDNTGAKDLVCHWSASGRMRHVDTDQFLLRDLKEDVIVRTKWIPTAAGLVAKHLYGPLVETHIRT